MKIGTWNLDHGRGSRGQSQRAVLSSLALDVAVLTEPGPPWAQQAGVVTSPLERVGPQGLEAWAAISAEGVRNAGVDLPFDRLAAAGITKAGTHQVLVYASVLPWRGIARHAPGLLQEGESYAQAFQRLLEEQVADIERLRAKHPGAVAIWAGDFNQSLAGVNDTGTRAGRSLVLDALGHLGMVAWNAYEPHAMPDRCAVDLICGPSECSVEAVTTIDPVVNGRRLSDHAGYVVEITLP